MFYPIKSFLYTAHITQAIYQQYKQLYVFRFGAILILLTTVIIGLFHSVSLAALFLLSLWISIIDIYDRIIPDILLLVLCFLLLILVPTPNIVTAITIGGGIIGIKLILEFLLGRNFVGWGDIKLFAVVLFFLRIDQLPWFFFICGVLLLCIHQLTRLKALPLAPFVLISFLMVHAGP